MSMSSSGSHVTRRWRKGDSNPRSRRRGEAVPTRAIWVFSREPTERPIFADDDPAHRRPKRISPLNCASDLECKIAGLVSSAGRQGPPAANAPTSRERKAVTDRFRRHASQQHGRAQSLCPISASSVTMAPSSPIFAYASEIVETGAGRAICQVLIATLADLHG